MPESNVPKGHTAFRRVTADEADPHRSWTAQTEGAFPNPHDERNVVTRFARAELPDPQKAVDAGLLPLYYPQHLIDDENVTQGPAGDVRLDDPVRERYTEDPGYEWSRRTDVDRTLEYAKAQVEGRDPQVEGEGEGGSSNRGSRRQRETADAASGSGS